MATSYDQTCSFRLEKNLMSEVDYQKICAIMVSVFVVVMIAFHLYLWRRNK